MQNNELETLIAKKWLSNTFYNDRNNGVIESYLDYNKKLETVELVYAGRQKVEFVYVIDLDGDKIAIPDNDKKTLFELVILKDNGFIEMVAKESKEEIMDWLKG